MRVFHPSTWPIALKLWLTLLFASLLPMSFIGIYNLDKSIETVEERAYENLELFARGTADRIDQLVGDTRQSVAEVAGDAEVAVFVLGDSVQRERLAGTAQQTLENVVHSNPDIASVMLLDRTGTCLASTNPKNLGQSYAYRDYFQSSMGRDPFVSELLVGSTTGEAGVYFTHKVTASDGSTAGVAVLKLTRDALDRIADSMHVRGKNALLVDSLGVVISASDRSLIYSSLSTIPAEVEARPEFKQRFASAGIAHLANLGLDELSRAVGSRAGKGRASYVSGGVRVIAGIGRLSTRDWTLVVEEPDSVFRAPMEALAHNERVSVVLVGLLVTVLAMLVAQNIVRPVKQLTIAAGSVARGHYDVAKVEARSKDELGELASAFNTMAQGLRERERERDMFGRVVSPEVREKLLGGELRLGGETLWVSVLFSDIRGFSTISEMMAPPAVVDLLNEYLTEMAEAVRPFHGYINNFIGDAIVVVFGAPIARPLVERLAVCAALAMRDRLARLNVRRQSRGQVAIETGIGISAGEVVAGNIGSLERMLYTVIGDAVNVASRLETLTKDYPGHSILVTAKVASELGTNDASEAVCSVERIGPVHVKGRVEPVDVFAIAPPKSREA
jgi:adenylate cyclase